MKKTLLTTALIAMTVTAGAAVPAWDISSTMMTVASLNASLAKDALKRIAKSQQSLSQAIQDSTSVINDAIKVAVKQEALSATQIAKADLEARKMELYAKDVVQQAEKNVEILLDYFPHHMRGLESKTHQIQNARPSKPKNAIRSSVVHACLLPSLSARTITESPVATTAL